MAIKIRPTGMTGLYGRLGKLAGQAQRAEKEEARSAQLQQLIRRQEHEKEMTAFRAGLDLEAEKRARLWQLEKMEIASRVDFEREERNRQRKLDEKQSRLDALERALKDGIIDKGDYQTAYLQETTGIPFYLQAQITQRQQERPLTPQQQLQQQIANMMAERTTPAGEPPIAPGGRLRVISPKGEVGTIETGEWVTYKNKGFKLADKTAAATTPAPVGKQEYGRWGPPAEWHRGLY